MAYAVVEQRLKRGGVIILDGGTGSELERRGVPMNAGAWCGPATLQHADTLEEIHRDYIYAGADVITANTFASSRLMLARAGLADRFEDINRLAVASAHRARKQSGREDVLVAGSLSHMIPIVHGAARSVAAQAPTSTEIGDAFGELAALLKAEGCDLIMLEMMNHPARMEPAFRAATETGLPVWAGFSARRGAKGEPLSFTKDADIPFAETVRIVEEFSVPAAGVMHTPSDLISDALNILRAKYSGPLMAYPDSGYFRMPNWQFEDIILPATFLSFATEWIANGVQIIGGCCGLSPEHIAAIAPLKDQTMAAD